MSEFKIEGECDKRFENVKKAFAENFQKRGELGAAVSIVMDGRAVVDLWGGLPTTRNAARGSAIRWSMSTRRPRV